MLVTESAEEVPFARRLYDVDFVLPVMLPWVRSSYAPHELKMVRFKLQGDRLLEFFEPPE